MSEEYTFSSPERTKEIDEELRSAEVKSKRGRGRSVAQMTAKAADNLRTDTESRIKFKRDQPRIVNSDDFDLNLYVPPGTVPEGYVGHWILDTGKGEVDKKLAEWWGHVTDAQGVNISRPSSGRTMYLMAIEESIKKEIDDLQMKRYRDSIGENDRADLGVAGVESYTPKGETNKIRINNDSGLNDPFAL